MRGSPEIVGSNKEERDWGNPGDDRRRTCAGRECAARHPVGKNYGARAEVIFEVTRNRIAFSRCCTTHAFRHAVAIDRNMVGRGGPDAVDSGQCSTNRSLFYILKTRWVGDNRLYHQRGIGKAAGSEMLRPSSVVDAVSTPGERL